MSAVLKHATLVAALVLSTIHSAAKSVAFPVQVEDSATRYRNKTESETDYKVNIVLILAIEIVIETTRRTRVAITDQNA
jgi:hypothetical protein